jgi:hypothetical protein
VTIGDLVFLASVLVVLVLVVRLAVLAACGRRRSLVVTAFALAAYVVCYGVVLLAVSVAMPRRHLGPHVRECFDDWCVAGVGVRTAADSAACRETGGGELWIATIEVSSNAKRVRQRARDASAELEDAAGRRYPSCAGPLPADGGTVRSLTDALGPGEAFRVALPFRVPVAAVPAGIVVSHGTFPGRIIIGADYAFLHQPTLLGVTVAGDGAR